MFLLSGMVQDFVSKKTEFDREWQKSKLARQNIVKVMVKTGNTLIIKAILEMLIFFMDNGIEVHNCLPNTLSFIRDLHESISQADSNDQYRKVLWEGVRHFICEVTKNKNIETYQLTTKSFRCGVSPGIPDDWIYLNKRDTTLNHFTFLSDGFVYMETEESHHCT